MGGKTTGASRRSSAKAKAVAPTGKEREKLVRRARQDAKQAVREHLQFRAFGDIEIHGTIIDGKSLMDRISADKYLKLLSDPKAPAFGYHYYSKIRNEYAQVSSSCAAASFETSPEAADLVVRESLTLALMAWEDKPQDGQPLTEFLLCETKDPLHLHVFVLFFCVLCGGGCGGVCVVWVLVSQLVSGRAGVCVWWLSQGV